MTVIEMKNDMMTIEDFEERAMAYGGDLDVWPEEDRAPARSLLAGSSVARTALDDARALDATLAQWGGEAVAPSQALLGRVLTDAATVAGAAEAPVPAALSPKKGWMASLFGDMSPMRPGLALAACLALGFVVGTTLDEQVLPSLAPEVAEEAVMIDFAFAIEDDDDLLLGPETLL